MKTLAITGLIALSAVVFSHAQNLPATEFHADGKVKCSYEKVDAQTVRMVRFHENGQLAEQGQYRNGRPDGRWQTWEADGTKTSEINYQNGVRHGEFRVYDRSNGSVTEIVYAAGKLTSANKWMKDTNFASNAVVK